MLAIGINFGFYVYVVGSKLALVDSIPKYVRIKSTQVSVHKGYKVLDLADLIRFGKIDIAGFSLILIHGGINDLDEVIKSGMIAHMFVQDFIRRYVVLRDMVRRRNRNALVVFSAILPRAGDFKNFFPYVYGVNFALRKWCAKSGGASIFVPTYEQFLVRGLPRYELFSNSDGLHLNGAGVERLEAYFQQVMSEDSKLLGQCVTSKITRNYLQAL